MAGRGSTNPEALLAHARQGDRTSLGAIAELYSNYLKLLARVQIDRHLQRRLSPSDLVQETFVKAWANFGQFRGQTEQELLAWLRSILVNAVKSAIERELKAGKRNARREVSLHERVAHLDRSVEQIDRALVSQISSPSVQAARRETAAIVADQLAALPAHYREVIVLRNLEGASFDEIAAKMGRSKSAVRSLWVRALDRLQNPPSESSL
jgi:RNA polymerase sigma-70 factor (ECF subfamily)